MEVTLYFVSVFFFFFSLFRYCYKQCWVSKHENIFLHDRGMLLLSKHYSSSILVFLMMFFQDSKRPFLCSDK